MSLFKNLFKKKPGGTLVGNLLRGVANQATGGILGNGAARIEVGQSQTNAQLGQRQEVIPQVAAILAENAYEIPAVKTAANKSAIAWAKQNWAKIAIAILVPFGLIVFFMKRKNNKYAK